MFLLSIMNHGPQFSVEAVSGREDLCEDEKREGAEREAAGI